MAFNTWYQAIDYRVATCATINNEADVENCAAAILAEGAAWLGVKAANAAVDAATSWVLSACGYSSIDDRTSVRDYRLKAWPKDTASTVKFVELVAAS